MNDKLDLYYDEFNEIMTSMKKQREEILKFKEMMMAIARSDASTPDQKKAAKLSPINMITMLRELTISTENIGGGKDEDNN